MKAEPTRKICPHCGHNNRFSAKNCAICGTPFYLVQIEGEMRKRCSACGHYNRMSAKNCTRCGTAYEKIQIAARGQAHKWCPQCGTPCRQRTKVCPRCGYRFIVRPTEAPIVQSAALSEPIAKQIQMPPPPDPMEKLRGEPAPYIPPEELKRLQRSDRSGWDLISRLLELLRGNRY